MIIALLTFRDLCDLGFGFGLGLGLMLVNLCIFEGSLAARAVCHG